MEAEVEAKVTSDAIRDVTDASILYGKHSKSFKQAKKYADMVEYGTTLPDEQGDLGESDDDIVYQMDDPVPAAEAKTPIAKKATPPKSKANKKTAPPSKPKAPVKPDAGKKKVSPAKPKAPGKPPAAKKTVPLATPKAPIVKKMAASAPVDDDVMGDKAFEATHKSGT